MVPLTRRRFLCGTAALLAGFAGCGDSPSGRPTPTAGGPRMENVEEAPEHVALRNPSDEPPAWLVPEDGGHTTDGASTAAPPRSASYGLLASGDAVERLRFADVDGADEARRFAEATDFDRETLLLEPHFVGECHRLELCYVTWSAADVHTQYGRHYRAADVACRTDARDATAWLIRIPDALDSERVRSRGSGSSSDGCRYLSNRRPTRSESTTEAVDLGPASPTASTTPETTAEDGR